MINLYKNLFIKNLKKNLLLILVINFNFIFSMEFESNNKLGKSQNYYQVLENLNFEIVDSEDKTGDLEVVVTSKLKKQKRAKFKNYSEPETNIETESKDLERHDNFLKKLNTAIKKKNIPVILALMEHKNFVQQQKIIKLMRVSKQELESIESKNQAREKKAQCMRITQLIITLTIIGILEAIVKLTPSV